MPKKSAMAFFVSFNGSIPRFQFDNLDVRNAVEGACVAVVGGTPVEQAAQQAQTVVDQKRGG